MRQHRPRYQTVAFSRDSIRLLNAAEYLGRKLDKEAFEQHLDAMMVLLSDLFRLKVTQEKDSLINEDIVERLEPLAQVLSVEQITDLTDRIEQVFLGLPRNVNRQLASEGMLITA